MYSSEIATGLLQTWLRRLVLPTPDVPITTSLTVRIPKVYSINMGDEGLRYKARGTVVVQDSNGLGAVAGRAVAGGPVSSGQVLKGPAIPLAV